MPRRLVAPALCALAVAAFAAQVFTVSAQRRQPRYDEGQYVALARDYAREGGIAATVACHLEGRCVHDNRHPLFQFLLVPFAHDGPSFYADAKLLTFATALALLAVAFLWARRLFGSAVATGTILTLSLLTMLAELSAGVLCDVMLAALVVLSVWLSGECQERGPAWWLAAGAAIGLAWLTKGNAHLLLVALALAGLHRFRWRFFLRPGPYVAALGFAAVSFFLLWRNAKVFGDPFHNFNARTLWLDDWQDVWTVARDGSWSEVGLGWYLERHSLWDLVERVGKGFGETMAVLTYTLGVGPSAEVPGVGPLTAGVVVPRALSGIALLALAAWGLVRRYRSGRRDEVRAVAYALLVLVAALSLGARGVGEVGTRFVIPLAALLVPYAVYALLDRLAPGARAPAWLCGAAAAGLAVKLVWFAPGLGQDPLSHFEVPAPWAETSSFLARHLRPGDFYAIPSNSLYSTFDRPHPDSDPRWPYTFQTDAATMQRHLREAPHVTLLLADLEDRDFPKWRDKLSAEGDARGPLSFLDWRRCFADAGSPSRFLVYCRPAGWGTSQEERRSPSPTP
jgi:hypothetical protein